MKTLLAVTAALMLFSQNTFSQDLIFDSNFNSGDPHIDIYPSSQTDSYILSYGALKKLNDSVFIYFTNYGDWITEQVYAKVYAKTISSNGTVSESLIMDSVFVYTNYPAEYWAITDIVTNSSNGEVFILSNFLDNGIRTVRIAALTHNAVSGTFSLNTNWGNSGRLQISIPNADLYGARGTILGNNLTMVYNYGSTFPIQTAFSYISMVQGNPAYSIQVITNNPTNMASRVADIIAISTTEIYIADNAFMYFSGQGTYSDAARVLKYNPSILSLDTTYGNGNGIATFSWNNQDPTPFQQDEINRMFYDGGKILVAGSTRVYDGSPVLINRGRISRFNSNGVLDVVFGNNGTFDNSFSSDYFNWNFYDIDLTASGDYMISAGGRTLNGGAPGVSGSFVLEVSTLGTISVNIGNNGFLFENTDYSEIREMAIQTASSTLQDKFVFLGNHINNQDPNRIFTEIATGRLKWSNASSLDQNNAQKLQISIYPNPANTNLFIEVNREMDIEIINTIGEKVMATRVDQNINSIDINALHSGIYILKSENGVSVKFVKQ